MRLYQIQAAVHQRADQIQSTHPDWPCRKGCADCCRSLASEPRVSKDEWDRIARAIEKLPDELAETIARRIRASSDLSRPVTCPLLESETGACLIYEARPIACRTYGFYAERDKVLGCSRIEILASESPDVVWGNHVSVEEQLRELGPAFAFSVWLGSERPD